MVDKSRLPFRRASRRAWSIATILGAAVFCGVVWLLWNELIGSRYAATDDAYVGADAAQVTPRVAGAISEVLVGDTRVVRRGEVIVRLDDDDERLLVLQATSDLRSAMQTFDRTRAHSLTLRAQVEARREEMQHAKSLARQSAIEEERTQVRESRRRLLVEQDAISREEYATALSARKMATSAMDGARAYQRQAADQIRVSEAELAENEALVAGTTKVDNPMIVSALANLRKARLALDRTVIRAPIDGIVVRRRVQVGQQVAIGDVLMSIVPNADLYVDAHFKEGQLRRIRVGQHAALVSDAYGGAVQYNGTVVGIGGGTGSAFAVIPAQNATGNWIKVVQRVPVRISLDPGELRRHPLKVGLSVRATVAVASSD